MAAAAIVCPTCDDYRLIADGDGELVSCPDCRPSQKAMRTARCLVHGQLVCTDHHGRLLGKCWECIREAANAIARIERRA